MDVVVRFRGENREKKKKKKEEKKEWRDDVWTMQVRWANGEAYSIASKDRSLVSDLNAAIKV